MIRYRSIVAGFMAMGLGASALQAAPRAERAQKLYEQVTPSLVAVKYTWESELGRRELVGAGIVVNEDGLVMSSLSVFDERIPDAQMKEFKILIPSQEKPADEIDAVFVGRDDRTSVAFLRPKNDEKDGSARHWKPLKFEEQPVKVGDPIMSIGLLPENASYKTYLMESAVAVTLRGEIPQVLVTGGGLAALGSPVFNDDGKAIGLVEAQSGENVLLNDTGNSMSAVTNPPKFYTPARDFVQSLEDPPAAGKPLEVPWLGLPHQAMTGLNKDVSEVFGLENKPAVQIGEVLPDTPAAKAGLKQGDIIVQVDGHPLERGDEASELPGILNRQIMRMKVGSEVTLGVLRKRGEPLQDVKVTLEARPPLPNRVKRFFAEDLGFSVRDLTFWDDYARKLPTDTKGVVVALIRPQSSSHTGGLNSNEMVTQLNGEPVTDVEQFEKLYKEQRKSKPREAVVLVVRRPDGREDTVRIEPPQ